jgi:hypothetical protein
MLIATNYTPPPELPKFFITTFILTLFARTSLAKPLKNAILRSITEMKKRAIF